MAQNVFDLPIYKEYKDEFQEVFSEKYLKNKENHSVFNTCLLTVEEYNHTSQDERWDNLYYSVNCQRLKLIDTEGNLLFEYKNVFGYLFWHIIEHNNGNRYLLCGNDLFEYVVYNFNDKTASGFASGYVIDDEVEVDLEDEFRYISAVYYNSKHNLVLFEGRDGVNHPIVVVADFSQPDILPLKTLNIGWCLKDLSIISSHICSYINWDDDALILVTDDGKVEVKNREIHSFFSMKQ